MDGAVTQAQATEGAKLRRWPASRLLIFVVPACVVALLGTGTWWIASSSFRESRAVEALLDQAYVAQRQFELRVSGSAAAYAPLRKGRGEERSTFSRPIALLNAESRIVHHLTANPDDADWLRLRARAEMLDGDSEDAVSTLKRAADVRPDDFSMLADLGAAYALRADGERREIDYGAAIEMLWRSLRSRPDAPAALFNRAIVYERMFLYEDARKDWEHYLRLDPIGGWAAEARGRKQAIERKMEARDRAMKSLASASGYSQSLKNGQAYDPEFYLESAVTDWLPASATDLASREAVGTLARLLREKHNDPWLEDLLKANPDMYNDARYRDATAHLAAAAKYNLADEAEAALEEATQSQRLYREAGVRAGELRGKYEESYALFRSLQGKKCVALASELAADAGKLHYAWIQAEALMESGNCRGVMGDRGGGRTDDERALSRATSSGYRTLELRVLGLLDNHATDLGNGLAAWQRVTDRLALYWQAPYRANRGHQYYYDLSVASAALGYKYTAFVFRRAAAEEISRTPNRVVEAQTRTNAASLADAANLPAEADREFTLANQLFAGAHQTGTLQLKRFDAAVARAQTEVKSNPQFALKQLSDLWAPGDRFSTLDTELIFHQAEGCARLMLRDLAGADAAFRRAIQCSEQELASLPTGADRYGPLRKSEDAYRGAVYVSLSRKPDDAFKQWEWYRAADISGSRKALDLAAALPSLPSEVLVSYVVFPDGTLNVWVLVDGKLESRRLSVRRDELELVAIRFARQCADPKSPLSTLRRDARQLYDWLIAPVAHRLKAGRVTIFEPDGPIGALPLQALIDPAGNYLGEVFPIVVSKGLEAYQKRSNLPPLTTRSAALLIADPALGNDLAKIFPPLEGAAREARDIAALFSGARILSGKESTLEALESSRRDVEVFHFSGHSVSSGGDAGLLLAESEGGQMAGRLLKSSTLLGEDWSRCSLAVLAACSTGTGERNSFVNPESLVRAFLNAGAGRVIASRWNVDTVATEGFMRRFYQSVLSGELPSMALREAAETLRRSPATAHPYYWAAFQLFGYK